MKQKFLASIFVGCSVLWGSLGCVTEESLQGDGEADSQEVVSEVTVGRPSNTKLRVASWNVARGSVFPKTDTVWRAINTSGKYQVERTQGAERIFKAVNADIWLLQETAYGDLPANVTLNQVDAKIRDYMKQITGDNSWQVRCNGRGLCAMIRGEITLRDACTTNSRVNAYLAQLRNRGNASLLLANVHYMNADQSAYTKTIVTGSSASAKFVAGDFNDVPGGGRYNEIDGIAGMDNVAMYQAVDAARVSASMSASPENAQGLPVNTKGYVRFGEGGLVVATAGGHIDHLFLSSTSNSWRVQNRFTLNTLLLSNATLNRSGLKPLDVVIQPKSYVSYFADFATTGRVRAIPESLYPEDTAGKFRIGNTRGMDHDHLPMVVDFDFPVQSSAPTPSLRCP